MHELGARGLQARAGCALPFPAAAAAAAAAAPAPAAAAPAPAPAPAPGAGAATAPFDRRLRTVTQVERLVKFIANFVAVDENGELDSAFANSLLEYLLELTNAKDKAVRLRSVQIITAVLGAAAENLDIRSVRGRGGHAAVGCWARDSPLCFVRSDELWNETQSKMLLRCKDKVPSVRAAAAFGLSFFQDPEDEDDEVVNEMMRMLSTDANKSVRP